MNWRESVNSDQDCHILASLYAQNFSLNVECVGGIREKLLLIPRNQSRIQLIPRKECEREEYDLGVVVVMR